MARLLIALMAAAPVWSQCILCRQGAAAQSPEAANSLDMAILVLLVPAVGIFCTVYAVAYKNRNKSADDTRHEDDLE